GIPMRNSRTFGRVHVVALETKLADEAADGLVAGVDQFAAALGDLAVFEMATPGQATTSETARRVQNGGAISRLFEPKPASQTRQPGSHNDDLGSAVRGCH